MCKTIIGQANINAQELQKIPIALPPLALQDEFAAFAEEAGKSKFVMQQGLEKLETVYKALMGEYFG
jgi:type I restriction enzyme S subunit